MADVWARLARAPARAAGATSDFDLNPDATPQTRQTPASVLIGIDDDARVLLTVRSSRLKHHPGQIAFPGGRQDPDDADVEAAALREAWEEVGLPKAQVEVLGRLPSHLTVTGYQVTPVLARIGVFDLRPEPGEVDEVFRVPLAHLLDPANYRVESREWRGQARYYYAVPWGPYYIWGATARMLRSLAEAMG